MEVSVLGEFSVLQKFVSYENLVSHGTELSVLQEFSVLLNLVPYRNLVSYGS